MRILLHAVGAEDALSPVWGHVDRSLRQFGDVFGYDPYEAQRLALKGAPKDQLAWILDFYKPDVIVVPCTDRTHDDEIRSLAQTRNVTLIEIEINGISNYSTSTGVGMSLCYNELFQQRTSVEFPSSDIVVMADATPVGVQAVIAMQQAGLSVTLYGIGWDEYIAQGIISHRPLSYTHRGDAMRAANTVVVLPGTPALQLLEASAAEVPAIAWTSISEVRHFVDKIGAARCEPPVGDNSIMQFWQSRFTPRPVVVNERKPSASVLIPIYNRQQIVGESIESALNQTHGDLEVVLYDDGSTDSSAAVAERYIADPRVRLIKGPNVGQTGRFDFFLRFLAQNSTSTFISYLGSDDVLESDSIEKRIAVMNEGADVVHAGCTLIDDFGRQTGVSADLDFSYDTTSFLRRALCNAFVLQASALVRRTFFDSFAEPRRAHGADFQFWIDGAREGVFRYLPEAVVRYRVHQANASNGPGLIDGTIAMGDSIRKSAIDNSTIADIFPALFECDPSDVLAWTAAFVQAGNDQINMGPVPRPLFAQHWYELAMANGGDQVAALRFNRAVAFSLDGDTKSANQELSEAVRLDPSLTARAFGTLDAGALIPGDAISWKPFNLPRSMAERAIAWDGSRSSTRRVLWLSSWSNRQMSVDLLRTYIEAFEPTDDVDLVIPTLGNSEEAIFQAVMDLLPSVGSPASLPPITIERIDDLFFVPLERFTLIVDEFGAIPGAQTPESFTQALERLRTVVMPSMALR